MTKNLLENIPLYNGGFCPQHCLGKPNLPIPLQAMECTLGIQTDKQQTFCIDLSVTHNNRKKKSHY